MSHPNDGAGERAEVGADVVQHGDTDQDAGEQCKGGSWVALKDAADQLGVSVDTVKRWMQRGELESRRETIPQGFRWLVFVEPAKSDAAGSILRDENTNQDIDLPRDSPDIVAALLHQLEGRNQEIARLHETIASLSRAVEHMGQLTATVSGDTDATPMRPQCDTDAPGSSLTDDPGDQTQSHQVEDTTPETSAWRRLRRWWTG